MFRLTQLTGFGHQRPSTRLYLDADMFLRPTVSRVGGDLTASLFNDADLEFAPSVVKGAVTEHPSLIADTDTFSQPAVTRGGLSVQPSLVSSLDAFFQPAATKGAVTLHPSLYSPGDTFFAPVVTRAGAGGASLSPPTGYSSGALVFEDVFAGSTLDSTKWIPQIADQFGIWSYFDGLTPPRSAIGHAGQYDAEFCDPSQITINNGLTITAVRSSEQAGYAWKSGCICTHGKYTFTGGYFQARVKCCDQSKGGWPAIWMLEGGGEIDVHEGGYIDGAVPVNDVLAVNLHTSGNSQLFIDAGVDLSAGYHIYGMEYVPGASVKIYLDGVLKKTYTSNVPTGGMTIVFSLQVMQNYSGSSAWHTVYDGTTPTLVMNVSCVQVYHL